MSYNRDHIIRFLEKANTSSKQDEDILARMKTAIGKPGDEHTDRFSASELDEVLGNPELVIKFNDLWNTGQLQD